MRAEDPRVGEVRGPGVSVFPTTMLILGCTLRQHRIPLRPLGLHRKPLEQLKRRPTHRRRPTLLPSSSSTPPRLPAPTVVTQTLSDISRPLGSSKPQPEPERTATSTPTTRHLSIFKPPLHTRPPASSFDLGKTLSPRCSSLRTLAPTEVTLVWPIDASLARFSSG